MTDADAELRERALALAAAGLSERAVARELGISRRRLARVLFPPAPKPAPPVEPEPPRVELTHAGVPAFSGAPWHPPAPEPPPTVDRLAQAGREQAAQHLAAGQPLQAKRALDVAVLAEKAAAAARTELQAPVTAGPRLTHLTDAEFDRFCDLSAQIEALTKASHDPSRTPAPASSARPNPDAAHWRFADRANASELAAAASLQAGIAQLRAALLSTEAELTALRASVYGRPRRAPLLSTAGESIGVPGPT